MVTVAYFNQRHMRHMLLLQLNDDRTVRERGRENFENWSDIMIE